MTVAELTTWELTYAEAYGNQPYTERTHVPLYLVRWPGLRVSLIRARTESELMSAIDEVDFPRNCTWRRYSGPLWVDFEFPAGFDVEGIGPSSLRPEQVSPKLFPGALKGRLSPTIPLEPLDGEEMISALMTQGLPTIGGLFRRASRPTKGELLTAVAREISNHEFQTNVQGATFDESGQLLRTEVRWYAWGGKRFVRTSQSLFDEFTLGTRSLRGRRMKARFASVEFTFSGKRRIHSVKLKSSFQFNLAPNGMIVRAHEATAFGEEADPNSPFVRRRNGIVRWGLSLGHRRALEAAVGRPIQVAKRRV